MAGSDRGGDAVTTWDEVAADLESRLAAAEAGLAAGTEPETELFDAPVDRPATAPGAAEQARLEAIVRRIAAIQEQVRRELTRIGGELADSGRKREAGSAYRRGATLSS